MHNMKTKTTKAKVLKTACVEWTKTRDLLIAEPMTNMSVRDRHPVMAMSMQLGSIDESWKTFVFQMAGEKFVRDFQLELMYHKDSFEFIDKLVDKYFGGKK